MVDEVVEESTKIVLIKYPGEASRKHELENAVGQDIRRLFGQIERGLTIEFRAEPKPDAEPEEKAALDTVIDFSRKIQFPIVAPEPMLLAPKEILEGEIEGINISKKTVTHKTTKTETRKEPKAD